MYRELGKILFLAVSFLSFQSQTAFAECEHKEHLILAAQKGNVEVLKLAAQNLHIDLRTVCDHDQGKISLLHIAAQNRQEDVIRFLINDCHFDVNDTNNDLGRTPLHFAVTAKDAGICILLVQTFGAQRSLLIPQLTSVYHALKDDFEKTNKIMKEDGYVSRSNSRSEVK